MAAKGLVLKGWGLTGVIALALTFMAGGAVLSAPTPVDGARAVIQLTAWASLLLFGLAFTASSLVRLAPTSPARWLLRHRRYLGVAFAISHLIHAVGIAALVQLDIGLFWQLANRTTVVAGGGAYLFILLMALTSFDRMVALLGSRLWGWLHLVGGWYIWAAFTVSMGKRLGQGPVYWLGLGVALSILAVRLTARFRQKAETA